jgi:hypothetical protein
VVIFRLDAGIVHDAEMHQSGHTCRAEDALHLLSPYVHGVVLDVARSVMERPPINADHLVLPVQPTGDATPEVAADTGHDHRPCAAHRVGILSPTPDSEEDALSLLKALLK